MQGDELQVIGNLHSEQYQQNSLGLALSKFITSQGKHGAVDINRYFSEFEQSMHPADTQEHSVFIDDCLKVATEIHGIDSSLAKDYLMKARENMRFYPMLEKESKWWKAAGLFDLTTDELYFMERPEAFYKALAKRSRQAYIDYSNIRVIAQKKSEVIPASADGELKAEKDRLELLIGKCLQWEGLYTLGKHPQRQDTKKVVEQSKESPTKSALSLLQQAVDTFTRLDQNIWKARALIDLANSLTEQKEEYDPQTALAIFAEVYEILDSLPEEGDPKYPSEDNKTDPVDSIRGIAKVKEGKVYRLLATGSSDQYEMNMQQSLAFIQEGLRFLEKTKQYYFTANGKANEGRIYFLLAQYELQRNNIEKARAYFDKAETCEREACDLINAQAFADTSENLHGAKVYKGREYSLYQGEREEYAKAAQRVTTVRKKANS